MNDIKVWGLVLSLISTFSWAGAGELAIDRPFRPIKIGDNYLTLVNKSSGPVVFKRGLSKQSLEKEGKVLIQIPERQVCIAFSLNGGEVLWMKLDYASNWLLKCSVYHIVNDGSGLKIQTQDGREVNLSPTQSPSSTSIGSRVLYYDLDAPDIDSYTTAAPLRESTQQGWFRRFLGFFKK